MPIILRLDRVMADRKISLNELAERVGISNVNLSNIKTGKIRAIRFSTLEAICEVLECQPGTSWSMRNRRERKSNDLYYGKKRLQKEAQYGKLKPDTGSSFRYC